MGYKDIDDTIAGLKRTVENGDEKGGSLFGIDAVGIFLTELRRIADSADVIAKGLKPREPS